MKAGIDSALKAICSLDAVLMLLIGAMLALQRGVEHCMGQVPAV